MMYKEEKKHQTKVFKSVYSKNKKLYCLNYNNKKMVNYNLIKFECIDKI